MAEDVLHNLRLPDGREFGPGSVEVIAGWAREGRVPIDALLAPIDGGPVRSVLSEPSIRAALQGLAPAMPATPSTVPGPIPPPDQPLAGMIPYKNPHALIGYYVSICSLIPVVGLIAGPAAMVLGIIGMRRRKADPRIRGLAHAWIALLLGLVGLLISITCMSGMIIGAMQDAR